jgi:hypothetical protein
VSPENNTPPPHQSPPPRQPTHPITKTKTKIEHEPEYFAAVTHLSDAQLAGFSADDFCLVRAATSAYGHHLFGKVRIPALPDEGPAYIHFRAFTAGPDDEAKLHSIREFIVYITLRPVLYPLGFHGGVCVWLTRWRD